MKLKTLLFAVCITCATFAANSQTSDAEAEAIIN